MELVELTLHNYKNHAKKVISFKPGVTGIVGDNGTGKSSIISAIAFLFTGEVDTKSKSDCITLGSNEGWVKGTFKLNGKTGSLERHLSSSKVVLTYDGETYNKVSEVNALWNDLLKIDSTIFNNVIIAKQGEIQKLFSDETTTREKIFQKIFMVPPTEKLRSLIWDNYVKGCPPEKLAEDVVALQSSQAIAAKNRNAILGNIDLLTAQLADDNLLKCLVERIAYLKRCIADSSKRETTEVDLEKYKTKIESLSKKIDEHQTTLDNTDYAKLQTTYHELLLDKKDFQRKQSMETERVQLVSTAISEDKLNDLKHAARVLQKETDDLQLTKIENGAKLRDISGKIHKFSNLAGHADCPSCDQRLPDIKSFLDKLSKEEQELRVVIDNANKVSAVSGRKLQQFNLQITSAESIRTRIDYLANEISSYRDNKYSEELFNTTERQIMEYEAVKIVFIACSMERENDDKSYAVAEATLAGLITYDGTDPIETELGVMEAALAEDTRIRLEIAAAQTEVAKLEHELKLCDIRIASSRVNGEYNARRKKYLDKLTWSYELLHVSQFPRKLIESYMDQVQTSLAGYLEHFDLPYSVKINDGFKIGLVNQNGKQLPTVSGGQEVMIGICLRLALHKMFAKSFPIWIIDEGTTHLSETRKPQYFNLINELRNQKIINQIIIIDHDERLSDVVDQTIQL